LLLIVGGVVLPFGLVGSWVQAISTPIKVSTIKGTEILMEKRRFWILKSFKRNDKDNIAPNHLNLKSIKFN
jgi:hypothetical protein